MIKYIRAQLLLRRMRNFMPEAKPFDCGGHMEPVSNSMYVNTSNMEVSIRCSFRDIPSHVKSFFQSIHNKQLEIHREFRMRFKIDLKESLSANVAAMNEAFERTFEKTNKLINDSDKFFGEFVTKQISVSTLKGHFGTYFVDNSGIKDEHGIVTFHDPYTLKQYTFFTHPFLYSVLDAANYRSTFNDFYSPWSY